MAYCRPWGLGQRAPKHKSHARNVLAGPPGDSVNDEQVDANRYTGYINTALANVSGLLLCSASGVPWRGVCSSETLVLACSLESNTGGPPRSGPLQCYMNEWAHWTMVLYSAI